jgi:hypothetical protein
MLAAGLLVSVRLRGIRVVPQLERLARVVDLPRGHVGEAPDLVLEDVLHGQGLTGMVERRAAVDGIGEVVRLPGGDHPSCRLEVGLQRRRDLSERVVRLGRDRRENSVEPTGHVPSP